jgi:tRNA 2-thiouridine synthesizing protein A
VKNLPMSLSGFDAAEKDRRREPMADKFIDARGLKCPLPALKIQSESFAMKPGQILEIVADCPTFETDARRLCTTLKKALLMVKAEGEAKRIQIRM